MYLGSLDEEETVRKATCKREELQRLEWKLSDAKQRLEKVQGLKHRVPSLLGRVSDYNIGSLLLHACISILAFSSFIHLPSSS